MKFGYERCESPIEKRLADAFSELAGFELRKPDDDECVVGRWQGWFLVLLSQVGSAPRVDFMIASEHPEDEGIPWCIIVEADGHAFHEKTKEQVARDKKRDRLLTRAGGSVLRYSGSEIHREADDCAEEALELAMVFQQKNLDEKFSRYLEMRAKEKLQ